MTCCSLQAIVLAVIFSLLCKKLLDDDVEDGDDEYSNTVFRDDDENGKSYNHMVIRRIAIQVKGWW